MHFNLFVWCMLNKEARFIIVSVVTYMKTPDNSSPLGVLFLLNDNL